MRPLHPGALDCARIVRWWRGPKRKEGPCGPSGTTPQLMKLSYFFFDFDLVDDELFFAPLDAFFELANVLTTFHAITGPHGRALLAVTPDRSDES